ncbi:MAG: MATE family efflux transporter [Acidobacteriaceae bacterium]
MRRIKFTIAKNALANIIRGGASAVVALALPHFLTKSLDADRFAAWSLMLQIAAYASYLDFGLQTALARFVAQAVELEQNDRRDHLVGTALWMLSCAGAVAMLIIGVVVWQLPNVFHGVPLHLLPEAREAVLILAMAACLSLPLSTFTGVLVGLHKNEYPAIAIGSSRLAGAVLAIVASHFTHSLVILASCIAVTNVASGLAQMGAAKRLLPNARINLSVAQRAAAQELARYCLGLTVWSFSTFLVSGLDVSIVGHYKFSAVGYYSIASVLINFIAGLNGAVFGALMTPLAALHAREEVSQVKRIVLFSTRINTYGNLLIYLLSCLFGYQALKLWVGPAYAVQSLPVLIVLAAAQAVRLTGYPFSVMLIATGQQNKGIAQALAEAIPNFVLSILLARYMGPVGVAWGTLIGAFCGVIWILLFTMKSTFSVIPIRRWHFLSKGILSPCLAAAPFALALLFFHWDPAMSSVIPVCLACLLISVFLAGRMGYFRFS